MEAYSPAVSGLMLRMRAYSKRLAFSGVPSEYFRSGCRVKVSSVASALYSHFSAAPGTVSSFSLNFVRPS